WLPIMSLLVSYYVLFFSLFFFYCSVHPRVLHSFPTRRSSDLAFCSSAHREPPLVLALGRPNRFRWDPGPPCARNRRGETRMAGRSEEHTSELQSLRHLVCRLLLEKKKHNIYKQ